MSGNFDKFNTEIMTKYFKPLIALAFLFFYGVGVYLGWEVTKAKAGLWNATAIVSLLTLVATLLEYIRNRRKPNVITHDRLEL